MTLQKFYKDGFALAVDLSRFHDNMTFLNGKKIMNTQSGVLLEITKKAISANIMYRVYVMSDALVNFVNNLDSIQY